MSKPTRTLNVIDCRQVHSGTDRNGKPFRIYEVTATNEDGSGIECKLRSFEQLPTGVGTYEVSRYEGGKYGVSYTLSRPGRGGGGGGGGGELRERVEQLESRLGALSARVEGLEQLMRQGHGQPTPTHSADELAASSAARFGGDADYPF